MFGKTFSLHKIIQIRDHCATRGDRGLMFSFFPCHILSYHPLIITPLWCLTLYQSLLRLGLFIQSSLLLPSRFTLVADIVSIGCRVA